MQNPSFIIHSIHTYLISCFISIIASSNLSALPLLEKKGRLTLDWSALKVRFYGVAIQATPQEDYSSLLRRALSEGIVLAHDKVIEIHKDHMAGLGLDEMTSQQSAISAGKLVATTTYSYKKEFYKNMGVKVFLENSLARVLRRQDLIFSKISSQVENNLPFTGLVLRSKTATSPKATYRIVDENGKVLFDIQSVAREAYQRNLMGRWYIQPTRPELTRAIGPKPISLSVEVNSQGDFVVQEKAWIDAYQDCKLLLENSQIVVALPSQ